MVHQFARKEINARLRQKIADKKPIVIGGAGIGLVAKIADQAGIDLLHGLQHRPLPYGRSWLPFGVSGLR